MTCCQVGLGVGLGVELNIIYLEEIIHLQDK